MEIEKNLLFDAGSWSHNNRSVGFGKTDAQQTGKTIDHIKGKKPKKNKKILPETMFFRHLQKKQLNELIKMVA